MRRVPVDYGGGGGTGGLWIRIAQTERTISHKGGVEAMQGICV